MEYLEAIKLRLKELMEIKKLSVTELSNKSKISITTVYNILNEKIKDINTKMLYRICKGCNITMTEFYNSKLFENISIDKNKE